MSTLKQLDHEGLARQLANALRPFIQAYEKSADPIGDSDLYPEQPRSVHVTLGDCRKAAMVLHHATKELGNEK